MLENEGLGLLIQIMSKNKDEEFNKAAMYLLSSCADIGKIPVSMLSLGAVLFISHNVPPTKYCNF